MKLPQDLLSLINYLKKLPGVGTRTAERFAFHLLTWDPHDLAALAALLQTLPIPSCPTCGCLTDNHHCHFCHNRDTHSLCLIASPRDAFSIEQTHTYRGLYHVLPHLLSPLDNRPTLDLAPIHARLAAHPIRELIIALDSTLEGDTTALYLKNSLTLPHLTISRLAFGLPIGTNLEGIDMTTLSRALLGRQTV